MAQLSKAQTQLVNRIRAGGRVFFNPATGLFSIDEFGVIAKIDQRPAEALILSGHLQNNSLGRCTLVDQSAASLATVFTKDQSVRWVQVVRGKEVGRFDATVVRASAKQIRIKTFDGWEHNVRPTALSPLNIPAGH